MVPEIESNTYKATHHGNCGRKVYYQVIAPIDVKIGESFSIDITFDVEEEIRAYTFLIFISGAGASWTNYIADDGDVVSAGTIVRNADVTPTEIGTVWVEIILGFYDSSDHFHFGSSSFGINMPRIKTYNELQSENSEWSYNYTSLEQSYDNYKSQSVGETALIRNLMLVFLITAIVFVVSTIYFATRKPKVQHT